MPFGETPSGPKSRCRREILNGFYFRRRREKSASARIPVGKALTLADFVKKICHRNSVSYAVKRKWRNFTAEAVVRRTVNR